mmetsp:Transcript_1953/g.3390  ORF Transcript_1953/g.3390 Transcript_1953/m.3390 type:complete len:183 (-) Transcript_1953:116-664(-)
MPITIPLISSFDQLNQIKKVTQELKSQFGYIYSSYAITFWTTIFAPRFLPRIFLHKASLKFTTAFSNVPGPVKPFRYTDPKNGRVSLFTWSQSYLIISGRMGLAVGCMSYVDSFKISITADEQICSESRLIVDLIETQIMNEIQKMNEQETLKPAQEGQDSSETPLTDSSIKDSSNLKLKSE